MSSSAGTSNKSLINFCASSSSINHAAGISRANCSCVSSASPALAIFVPAPLFPAYQMIPHVFLFMVNGPLPSSLMVTFSPTFSFA